MSVFINIIQKFYLFSLKAVFFFQQTMRVNFGMSLSNTGIYLRCSRELSQKRRTYYEHFSVKHDKNLRTTILRGNLLFLIKKSVFVYLLMLSRPNLNGTS